MCTFGGLLFEMTLFVCGGVVKVVVLVNVVQQSREVDGVVVIVVGEVRAKGLLEIVAAVGILGDEGDSIRIELGMSGGEGVLVLRGKLDRFISVPVGLVHIAWVSGCFPSESMNHFLETLCLLVAALGLEAIVFDVCEQ